MRAVRRHPISVTAAALTLVGVTAATAAPASTPTATSMGPTAAATPSTTAPTAIATSSTSTSIPTATPTATPTPTSTTATGPSGAVPSGIAGSWKTVFSDDFSGSALNTAKWSTGWLAPGITKPVNSEEMDCYDPAQVGVSGGTLELTAIQKTETCGSTEPYASGLITSNGKFEFTYGAVEARIYTPAAPDGSIANWPAFWSDGQSWPADGENDVMEGLGGDACFHFHSPSGRPGGCASGEYDYTGWHTYGADWEPGSVTYYYDGVRVGQITLGITSAPQYLILDNAVGGGGTTVVPSTMMVDYVRVWQH